MLIDSRASSDPLRRRLRRLLPGERREEALHFIDLFYRECGRPEAERLARRRAVSHALSRHGWYEHTREELAFGARVAWRNSAGCVGRLFWKSLDVFDCRSVNEPDEMAARLVDHLRLANVQGRTPSIMTIFAPMTGDETPPYVENRQLVQYAGYLRSDGVLGDPATAEFTRTCLSLGWSPPGEPTAFDVLPLIIRGADGARRLYRLPPDCFRQMDIVHPRCDGLARLGLRWYAVPVVSDMILTVGGVDYPCAPFNGHYVATEIASRNLVDPYRYDLLEAVGRALGLDLSDLLWRDVALTELNRAVLHSFQAEGVTICDHHTASDWFMTFLHAEHAAARNPSADWKWIVPPQAAAACPTFHMDMHDFADVPNFYRSRATDGGRLGVSRAAEMEGGAVQRLRRLRRRVRRWIRERG
ncbi:MAG: nitric oxide synthase oxygenase [Phenylobacterium sp.]|uniref:nitric oxide synthase oxygenase n=1 Tax=Phenylobacterium sp. TaxID=1871053 RepID=UPI001A2D12AD|nr:nitric oxide synthase oxygenase [Phenylobacterium sp.]MBJ7413124.1 nitric oxide synthase oxygenase [Phenylobacterium sp.]